MTKRKNGMSGLLLILVLGSVFGYLAYTGVLKLPGCVLNCANQWASFDQASSLSSGFQVGINCSGSQGFCWNCPANIPLSSGQCGTSYCPNISLFYTGNKNGVSCASWQTSFLQPLSFNPSGTPIASLQAAGSSCQNGSGWTLSNACATAAIQLPASAANLPIAQPCLGLSGLQLSTCQAVYISSSYQLNANLLPAKLLGQDNNFTNTFGDSCSPSTSAACSSSSQCPSSASTGCQTLVRSFTTGGTTTTVTDFIYSFGVDLRVSFLGQQPTFTILCAGGGIGSNGFTNGPCAGAAVSALQSAITWINGNDQVSGDIIIDISAPYFAYSSSYDYYGLWNAYLAQRGCFGTGASNISPCNLGGHASLNSNGNNVAYKDPSQWTAANFISLPQGTLAKIGKIDLHLSGLGPSYTVSAINSQGTDANCQSDLNSGSPTASTCRLAISGGSLVEIPIIFQELAQATVTSNGGNTCVSGCTQTNGTTIPPPCSNCGNVTKTYQNYTSPYIRIVVKVSDTSGLLGFLTCCGGFVVTLNPTGQQNTTSAQGIAVFSGLSPPPGNTQYSVYVTDPGGFSIGFISIPPNHITPSGTVTIPNQGTGTYNVSIVMTTTWSGTITILILLGIIAFILVAVTAFGFVRFAPRQTVSVARGFAGGRGRKS